MQTGKVDEALAFYQKAMENFEKLVADSPTVTEYRGGLAASYYSLAVLHQQTGKSDEALAFYQKAIENYEKLVANNPTVTEYQDILAGSYNNLGILHEQKGKMDEALASYQEAIENFEKLVAQNPTVTEYQDSLAGSYNKLSWPLATCPDDSIRNGRLAIKKATRACELTDWNDANYLDTLAAAYAEAGNYDRAKEYQRQAIDLATDSMKPELKKHLDLYESGKPYRDSPRL